MEPIRVNQPGSKEEALLDGPGGFDRGWFMGTWGVAWSTLPMWNVRKIGRVQDKRDVQITYVPTEGEGDRKFESTVSSHKRSAGPDSKASTVSGTETLTPGTNGATFDWRGKGWLFFVSSHWEVLGYGKDETVGLEWAVTFFSKTLFTPQGIDIYIRRQPSALPNVQFTTEQRQALLEKVIGAVKGVQAGGIGELAQKGFQVPGVV